jgi:hypothetical protein
MKRFWVVAMVVCAVASGVGECVFAQDAVAPFKVARFVFCTKLENLEPADAGDKLPAGHQMILAFFEARQITADTTATFVWIYGGKEVRSMTVEVPKGPRWRTFDGKIPGSATGPWRVELRNPAGQLIQGAEFTVQ